MPKILSLKQLRELTSSFRSATILRELDFMKIPYKTTSRGHIVVFEDDLKRTDSKKITTETWQLNR